MTTEYVSFQEEDVYRKREIKTSYTKTTPVATKNQVATSVYSDKVDTVWKLDTTTFTPKPQVSYDSTIEQDWPAVLSGLTFQTWPKRDGTNETSVVATYSRDSYRGPCKCTVTEIWSEDPPNGGAVNGAMFPTPLSYATPLFRISVESCLHPSIKVTGTTGTSSEEWEFITYDHTFSQTTPTDWPSEITAQDVAIQASGGWLRRTVTVSQPS
jgi:hypothetical protein